MTDAELIAWLRRDTPLTWKSGQTAADRIEALVKQCEGLAQAAMNNGQALILAEDRAERLEAAVAILEDALQEAGDDYPGSSMQQWCQQQVKAARAALKGDDHV